MAQVPPLLRTGAMFIGVSLPQIPPALPYAAMLQHDFGESKVDNTGANQCYATVLAVA